MKTALRFLQLCAIFLILPLLQAASTPSPISLLANELTGRADYSQQLARYFPDTLANAYFSGRQQAFRQSADRCAESGATVEAMLAYAKDRASYYQGMASAYQEATILIESSLTDDAALSPPSP